MSLDLVPQLRKLGSLPSADPISADTHVHATLHKAADAIIRLDAEVAALTLAINNVRASASDRESIPRLSSTKSIHRNAVFALVGRLAQIERFAREAMEGLAMIR